MFRDVPVFRDVPMFQGVPVFLILAHVEVSIISSLPFCLLFAGFFSAKFTIFVSFSERKTSVTRQFHFLLSLRFRSLETTTY